MWDGARRTTIGGYEAYLNVGTYSGASLGDPTEPRYDRAWVTWVPLAEGGVSIVGDGWAEGMEAGAGFDESQATWTACSARFSSGTSEPPGRHRGFPARRRRAPRPWRTVGAGIGAVAAAAVALAGAAASARAKTGAEEPPPDQPVGYVLQLSRARLTVSAEHSATFTAQAFKVLPNGSYQPASTPPSCSTSRRA